MTRRLLREPLLHFALLGSIIFVAYRLVASPALDGAEIVITADRVASLRAQFAAMHDGRPPNDELQRQIDAYVRDEMLYREGLAMGLDRDDPVVRNRVRQKADLLSEDAMTIEPSDDDLAAFLEAHQTQFDIPARVSFDQVYFDPAKHRGDLASVIELARGALENGQRPDSIGDRTLLPAAMTDALPQDIEAMFGGQFQKQLARTDGHGWQGPLTTTYGSHLVRIRGRGEPTRATLADAHDEVAREWSRAQATKKTKEQFYRALAHRYPVRIEPNAHVGRIAER